MPEPLIPRKGRGVTRGVTLGGGQPAFKFTTEILQENIPVAIVIYRWKCVLFSLN